MAKLKTGRHTSALKKVRQDEKKTVRNVTTKSKIKTMAKKVESAVKAKDVETAKKALQEAFSAWDKAEGKHVIHKNTASNQKARLSKLVASI